jgi:hypothetical protein
MCTTTNLQLLEETDRFVGYIVNATGEIDNIQPPTTHDVVRELVDICNAIPVVDLAGSQNRNAVVGVISGAEKGGRWRKMTHDVLVGSINQMWECDLRDRRLRINSVGEGGIWVCDEGGNFVVGDLITVSSVKGVGMKQADNIIRSDTVGKITMMCDFLPGDVDIKRYQLDENGERVVDEFGVYVEVIVPGNRKKYLVKYVDASGRDISLEEYDLKKSLGENVFRCAFVGCVYVCG